MTAIEGIGVTALKAHLALNVSDLEENIEFYRRMLGIEPMKVRPGYAKFDVQNPPLNLTLNQVPHSGSGTLSHLGIQVASTEDVLAVRDRWVAAGLSVRDEMGTNCCYATQDKSWVVDPEGNEWEVFVVLNSDVEETSSSCCEVEAVASTPAHASSCCGPAAEATVCCN